MLGQEQLTQKGLTQRWLTQRTKQLFVPKLLFQGTTGWWHADYVEKDSSNAVSILYDNSRNGFHLIQNTQVNKPILVENQINEKPALRFDGVNDFMQVNFGQTFAQPNTYFIVWNVSQSTGISNFAFTGLDDINRNALIFNPVNRGMFMGSPTSIEAYLQPSTTFNYIFNTLIFNSSSSRIFENKILKKTLNLGSSSINGFTIGANPTGSLPLKGNICELIFFNKLLTQPETQIVNNYFSEKYGLF